MDRLLLGFLLAGSLAALVEACPLRCTCQNLSESLSTLCANKGLLSVPLDVDRRTVELRLADNFIRAVGPPDFVNMSGLVDLTLSRNAIGLIQPFAFADLGSLRSLHLDGNRLGALREDNLSGLVSLQHLIVNNNQLGSIAASAFDDFLATLEDLDLSFNNLPAVPWEAVRGMVNLHALNLDHNLIESVAPGAFARLSNLARLDITSNRLRTLPPDSLFAPARGAPTPPAPALALSFGGNPLHCNCELLWLRRLPRPDEMETCATPAPLAGRHFWSVPEEEFACEPPLITRHTHRVWVLEGQRATLRCRAVGDPPPALRWVSPGDRIVGNSSRVASYRNGTLDILVTAARDAGAYTCFATNAAGESAALAELRVIPLPRPDNGSAQETHRRPASSSSSDGPASSSSDSGTGTEGRRGAKEEEEEEAGVTVAVLEVTSTTALVRWPPAKPRHGVWMYQIQYNSSADETLVYRIIPSTSKAFVLKNLIAGADYDLCVLAISGDSVTQLAATRVVGCARFGTEEEEYPRCHPLDARFLGGTLTVAVGGVAVVTLLVSALAALVRHKLCGAPKLARDCSQTGGRPPPAKPASPPLPHPPPSASAATGRAKPPRKRPRSRQRGEAGGGGRGGGPASSSSSSAASSGCRHRPPPRPAAKARRSRSFDTATACYGYAKRLSVVWTQRSQSVHGMLLRYAEVTGQAGDFCGPEELEESVV